jgi:uncharacterized protein
MICPADRLAKSPSVIKPKVHAIAPVIFEGTPVLFAYLYGSFAQGSPHPFSDLDIAVFVEGLTAREYLDVELSLALRFDDRLDHAVPTDVRVLNLLPLVVKGRILSDGELIYSIAEDKRIDFETRVRTSYFDFQQGLGRERHCHRRPCCEADENGEVPEPLGPPIRRN